MTSAKQLFSLQEMDLILDRLGGETHKAERELSEGFGLDHVENALREEDERLLLFQSQRREQQFEVETQRERSTKLDEQLYGGTVTNPRDLESLEKEASHARELLEQHDAELLNLSVQAEESQAKKDSLEKEFTERNSAWEKRQAELESDIKRCTGEMDAVVDQRAQLAATLDPVTVQRYEGLRKAKGGLAVARVERGLCQACWMSLPTQQQQQVRSGRQTVMCSSCGRILYPT